MKLEQTEKIITKSGYAKIKEELKQLVTVIRPKNLKNLQHAREQGDLSENSDFDAAKKEQGQIEERISFLKKQLELTVVSDNSNHDLVRIGSKLKFKYIGIKNDSEDAVEIVGAFENDIFSKPKKISYYSWFAQCLLKQSKRLKVNDIVHIPSEKLKYSIKILKIY